MCVVRDFVRPGIRSYVWRVATLHVLSYKGQLHFVHVKMVALTA